MTTSVFDPCLLVTNTGKNFGIAGMQTDDTLLVGTAEFMATEEEELKNAKLLAKPKKKLSSLTAL